jgi:hypothetical protein
MSAPLPGHRLAKHGLDLDVAGLSVERHDFVTPRDEMTGAPNL